MPKESFETYRSQRFWEKSPPDSKPNPIPNLTPALPLTPHRGFFPGRFFPDTISKTVEVSKLIFGPLPLGEKVSYEITTVGRSICQYVSR